MKKLEFAVIALAVITLATGCGAQPQKIDDGGLTPEPTSQVVSTSGEETGSGEQTYDQYVTVGEIIEIEAGKVHVLTGDIAQIFDVTQESLDQVYIGETVGIEEIEGGQRVVPFKIKDFSVRHTNMGHMIDLKTGKVKTLKEGDGEVEVAIDVEGQEIVSTYTGKIHLVEGNTYDFDLMSFGDGKPFILDIYDPASITSMTIDKLIREDNGNLTIFAKDADGGEYYVPTYHAVKNFNFSDLQVGDQIDVYVTLLMESFPMQVETNKIILK